MLIVIKRKTLRFLLCLCLLAVLGATLFRLPARKAAKEALADMAAAKTVWIIDAGHGGEDGGAVAADGTKESDINLAIAQRLARLLTLLGEEACMTRTEDISIHDEDASSLRQKKRSDLENRTAIVNGTPNAVLVSIHQNSLPSSVRTHGAQVFYGTHQEQESAALAHSVQELLNRSVNAGNEKSEKKIDPTIYLMNHAAAPAILVECGFLSNAAETALLKEEIYQQTLAAVIAAGILNTKQ